MNEVGSTSHETRHPPPRRALAEFSLKTAQMSAALIVLGCLMALAPGSTKIDDLARLVGFIVAPLGAYFFVGELVRALRD